jgi:polysaccharide biosynthesis/export protein
MKTRNLFNLLTIIIICFLLLPNAVFSNPEQSQSENYAVGPGDKLDIQVWGHEDLKRVVEVSPDGTFSFPFIGKIEASGKNVYTLESILVNKLSNGYLVGPQVSITVAEYNYKKAFLFGEVNRPGSYILKDNMRLLELVSEAGGFTNSRGSTGTVIRSSDQMAENKPVPLGTAGDRNVVKVNLIKLTKGDPKENILIHPNDTVYINTAQRLYVTGEVKRPGEIVYTEGMTVRQAISMAGGETPKASIRRIRIVRETDGREKEIKPQLGDRVHPNDILKVPESFF